MVFCYSSLNRLKQKIGTGSEVAAVTPKNEEAALELGNGQQLEEFGRTF